MDASPNRSPEGLPTRPWNKDKMIGSKPPLRRKNVWSIGTKLQIDRRSRDLGYVQRGDRQQTAAL